MNRRGDRRKAPTADSVATRVRDDPPEPCVEPIWLAQAAPVAPGGHERVVDRILCLCGVAQDEGCQTVARIELSVGQTVQISRPGHAGRILALPR